MRILLAVAVIGLAFSASAKGAEPAIPSLYGDDRIFVESIAAAEALDVPPRKVSGLTVPHHLVAADLIARAFLVARENRYDRIVVLTPDHFKRSRRPFATTRRPFETVFGQVPADVRGSRRAPRERHARRGVGSVRTGARDRRDSPLRRALLSRHADRPVAITIGSTRDEWDALIDALDPLITERTLILQSTDFSHYLPLSEAILRDQETLNVIAAGDIDAVEKLRQPQHLDSRGGQYIQMRLQAKHFGASPVVIANTNMQLYLGHEVAETTSYIVQIYPSPEEARRVDFAGYEDGETLCFAGDTFFGRHLAPVISQPEIRDRLLAEIEAVLGGCPLVLNLEGVMVPEMPTGIGEMQLAMPEDLTLDWLKRLNVVAVSIANNHSRDLGDEPRAAMAARLEAAGIAVLDGVEAVDLGPLRAIALTDLENASDLRTGLVTDADLEAVTRSDAAPPLAAFMHWGTEYEAEPGSRETQLVDALRQAAVSLIVGAHPHVASDGLAALAGGESLLAYSLGNFLFDQPGRKILRRGARGALLPAGHVLRAPHPDPELLRPRPVDALSAVLSSSPARAG